ncbi:Conidiation protein 6-domain-containing protein [Pisolithus marmoratus]|nr:Conidiation protein 6-domain-containing protein [Pisolithus marmoratus]
MVQTEHTKDTTRVIAGLKAAIHNPHVSEEAKEHAMERLREMGQDVDVGPQETVEKSSYQQDEGRVLAGYKATLSNPYTSEEAKKHAEEVLQAAGIYGRHQDATDEEHETRVLAGYKAALHNPRVSDAAKQHARQYLEEHGVETD